MTGSRRWKLIVSAVGVAIIVATFAFLLPKFADYAEVWDVARGLTWPWIGALIAVAIVNLATFAPPWQVALPGLRFWPAFVVTQASTAASMIAPGGSAVGIAASFSILNRQGFRGVAVGRAVSLTSLWNQLANFACPVAAIFLLAVSGYQTAILATAAFIGAGVFCTVVVTVVVVLMSDNLATDVGDLAARGANAGLRRLRRGPVTWSGASFERFRLDAVDLLRRRWHVLTVATLLGTLSTFAVLFVCLRALDVPAADVSLIEAFAAWSLARLLASIEITPGGIGVFELSLTAALVSFGAPSAGAVAAVLVYRAITMLPTLAIGLVAFAFSRRRMPTAGPDDAVRA